MALVTDRATVSGGRWLVQRFHGSVSVEFHCPGAPPSSGAVDVVGTGG
jgi:hypothetical protein